MHTSWKKKASQLQRTFQGVANQITTTLGLPSVEVHFMGTQHGSRNRGLYWGRSKWNLTSIVQLYGFRRDLEETLVHELTHHVQYVCYGDAYCRNNELHDSLFSFIYNRLCRLNSESKRLGILSRSKLTDDDSMAGVET